VEASDACSQPRLRALASTAGASSEWREASARATRTEATQTTASGLPRRSPGDRLVPPPRASRPSAPPDERVPEPRLVPDSAGAARAEEWGDQVLQSLVRRVVWAALVRAPDRVMGYTVDAKLLVPRPVARLSAPLIARLAVKLNDASDPNVRADLRALPHHLDRIDGWIEDGSLAEDAIAARLQVGSGLRLLMTLEDVRPLIDARPAGRMARDVFPIRAGSVGAGVLPSGWLP